MVIQFQLYIQKGLKSETNIPYETEKILYITDKHMA